MKSDRAVTNPVTEKIEVCSDTIFSAVSFLENKGKDAFAFQEATQGVQSFQQFFEIFLTHLEKR